MEGPQDSGDGCGDIGEDRAAEPPYRSEGDQEERQTQGQQGHEASQKEIGA